MHNVEATMAYNPFNKPTDAKLDVDDLRKLVSQQVSEGYFVEYKTQFPENKKIGHSIASFANTYGGWYFVGVKEQGQIASDICGFKVESYPNAIEKIREVIISNINPVPVFHPQLVNIGNDLAVLAVYIPPEQETPFITIDGRIYRRVSDSSNPIPETDRFAVDRLVDRGREIILGFERFCSDERTFCEAEEEQVWINLFLSPNPLPDQKIMEMLSVNSIDRLLEESHKPMFIRVDQTTPEDLSGNLPFNVGQITNNSVILHQIELGRNAYNGLMLELFIDGRARVFIPGNITNIYGSSENQILVESPKVKKVLQSMSQTDRNNDLMHLRFLNIGNLSLVVCALVTFWENCFPEILATSDIRMALVIDNAWRVVPFFDHDIWAEHVQKRGLPVVRYNRIRFPDDKKGGYLISSNRKVALWVPAFQRIGMALGLPLDICYEALGAEISRVAVPKKA